ncbi:MAG: IGHMBP2 family helicase [Cyclobacteriaceae bacterium]|nr:IGHMBP2 family helicase [Cyclobacteriaceae bacterium]
MNTVLNEIRKLEALLYREKQTDLEEYKRKVEQSTVKEKIEQGVCWYPVILKTHFYGTGERLIIEIERTKKLNQEHLFQPGKVIAFFNEQSDLPFSERQVSGVVNYVKGDLMSLTLNADDLPDWSYSGKLGVNLMFDEASYREMFNALKVVMRAGGNRLASLRDILLGFEKPGFTDEKSGFGSNGLNASQISALNRALSASDVSVIHGPPGTGKTTTLVEVIVQTLRTETQVLVCAPSNAAIDLISQKLGERNVSVLRLGHPARVTEEMMEHTLDAQIARHSSYADLKALRKNMEAMRQMAGKYKRNYGRAEREQRKLLLNEAQQMKREAEMLEDYITTDLLTRTRVIACTLVGSAHSLIKNMYFSTVFIDEAAQALEPACWIPITRAHKVVFAGDHCQLPPTIKSMEAANEGLSETLMEKVVKRHPQTSVMLREQYRMHEDIMAWSSRHFYQDKLKAHSGVAQHLVMPEDDPLVFIDTAGSGYEEITAGGSKSTENPEEARFVLAYLEYYLKGLPDAGNELSIGLISPYKAQVELFRKLFSDNENLQHLKGKISINTVDAFQGQERDVIFISLVRSNPQQEIGFLKDIRRMNVSMTRARMKLVMTGDSSTLGNHPFYKGLIEFIAEKGYYHSAFEYPDFM